MGDKHKSSVTKEKYPEEESGVKESEEAHKERMHTPDEPEELKFDDAFETSESPSGPASDFKDGAEDEEKDEWTRSETEEYEDFLKSMPCPRKAKRSQRGVARKGKENRMSNEPAKRQDLTSQNLQRLANIQLTPRYLREIKTRMTETREGDFIEALRRMLKPMTDEKKNLEKKVNTLSLIDPSGSTRPPAESPFVPRSVQAFERLKESCNDCMGLTEWSDDDDEDKTESCMKMEIPAFEGKDVERFSVRFARYLLLTGKHQCKDKVKAALLIEVIKKRDIKLRAENSLKKVKSLEDFFDRL